jgi:AraC-like DNA-binding protein
MSHINTDLRETHIIGTGTREYLIAPQIARALALHQILLAGISYARPPFRFVRPRPQTRQVLACLEGCGEVLVDGQWRRCLPGEAYLTPARVMHAYHAIDGDGGRPWKICWVTYEVGNEELAMPGREQPVLIEVDPHGLAAAIEGLYHECIGQAEETVMHLWAQLLHRNAQRLTGQGRFDGRLHRLWRIVDANLANSWRCEELAAAIDVSSEHLRRLCQQQFGHSPMKHVTALRMQRAMALLASDSFGVEAVARYVGYENPFAFSTAFKRYVGVAPSEYRQGKRLNIEQ